LHAGLKHQGHGRADAVVGYAIAEAEALERATHERDAAAADWTELALFDALCKPMQLRGHVTQRVLSHGDDLQFS
jgi:hypothetical protein